MHAFSRFVVAAISISLIVLSGCGVRTPLDIGMDGSVPVDPDSARPDSGRPDGGACRTSADCDDRRFCNGAEACLGGTCVPGDAILCEDFVSCTDDRCDEGSDTCSNVPDDALCGGGAFCDPFAGCVGLPCGSDFECNDGFGCNGVEICGPDGLCVGGIMVPDCDDRIDCTIDVCSEPGTCDHLPDPSRCLLGATCDRMLGCGECSVTGDCGDARVCNGTETCGADGFCIPGTPPSCDDGIACTRDECLEVTTGCTSTPDSTRCPDARLCIPGAGTPDGCVFVECRSDFDCDDGVLCNGAERCDPGRRVCMAGVPPDCNDFQECTIDRCVETFGGCIAQPRSMREVCGNHIDDDCDGLVDCVDGDCSGVPGCPSCVPMSDLEIACSDAVDQDCDGLIDCLDDDCAGSFECCRPTAPVELDCFDGRDDDCDSALDCGDPDCERACAPPEECGNRFDDDRDGLIDCADPDCRFDFRCRDAGPPPDGGIRDAGIRDSGIRDSGIRDSGIRDSGIRDSGIRDSGIRDSGPRDAGPPPRAEIGIAACTNGRDDDMDGRVDCRDSDCSPLGPMGECCNDRDDDGDGTTDVFTCRCFDDSTCVGVGDYEQVCWESSYSLCAPRCNFYGGDAFCRMYLPDMPRCNAASGECVR